MRSSRRGPSGPPRRLGALLCFAGLALAGLVVVPAAAAEAPAFCHQRFVRDYEAPLREMPRQHPPPKGELPFGPRNFSIHRIGNRSIALQGADFGYRFGGKNEPARVLDLRWHAKATLRAVDSKGRVRRLLGVRQWRVKRVKELDPLQLSFPAEHPGFFRVDLLFETLSGRRLGSYRDYFRVLRRSTDVGLRLSGTSFHPGEVAFVEIANRGAGWISGRGDLALERDEGGIWASVPLPPTPESVRDIRWLIGPGEAGGCERLSLPADLTAGLYRFSAPVYVVDDKEQRALQAPFEVVP